ncbi:MarR family transcriptional regulator [Candidatus Woesearchaeota archaeon]|nr:MarR family transcriptional regulator [Candidatus Woesearchaeota archaeon]
MKNRAFGLIIIGIAALIGFIVYSFNRALDSIVDIACTHGPTCPMQGTINFQTSIGLAIMLLLVLVGVYMIFFSKEEKIVTKTVREQVKPKQLSKEHYKKILNSIPSDEKIIFEKIIDAKGTIFQSELVEKTDYSKVKITRMLDRLEGKGFVERKRRGMTNIVILKV